MNRNEDNGGRSEVFEKIVGQQQEIVEQLLWTKTPNEFTVLNRSFGIVNLLFDKSDSQK